MHGAINHILRDMKVMPLILFPFWSAGVKLVESCSASDEQRIGVCYSVHLGNLVNATENWVPVVHFQAFTFESIILHTHVVEGANGVQVRALSKFFELLLRLVKLEHLFHAVVVLAHIVLVLKDAQGSVDLIFVAKHFFFVYLTNNIYIKI